MRRNRISDLVRDQPIAPLSADVRAATPWLRASPREPAPPAPVSGYHIADALLAPGEPGFIAMHRTEPPAQLSPLAATLSERSPLNPLISLNERSKP